MNVGSALTTALAGLKVASAGIDLTSRNISNASAEGYTRKIQAQTTGSDGAPDLGQVQRAVETGLQKTARDAASNVGMLDVQHRYANQISLALGNPADAQSLSNLTADLGNTLQSLAASPQSASAYQTVLDSAARLAGGIQNLYRQAGQAATVAGEELSGAISSANQDLALIDGLNKQILGKAGGDNTDLADRRDQAIADLAAKLDITTVTRADGGISVYTKSGTVLVDASASQLATRQTPGGGVELIVQANAGSSASTSLVPRSGAIKGLLDVINADVPTLQGRLDAFASTLGQSISAAGVPLFTPNPASGATIRVNPAIVAEPSLIRDGASPTPLAPGDTTYIDAVREVFERGDLTFDDFNGPGQSATNSLAGAAADLITGASAREASLAASLDGEKAVQTAISNRISTVSGVNLDVEFSHLLQLQQSYAANARVISVAQSMLETLLADVGHG